MALRSMPSQLAARQSFAMVSAPCCREPNMCLPPILRNVISSAASNARSNALATLLAREHLNVMPERALRHYTHEKNPVACAAGLATIECLEADGLLENARLLGEDALRRIEKMKKTHPLIGGGRGLGLLMGIE